jgi:hypothetical protein
VAIGCVVNADVENLRGHKAKTPGIPSRGFDKIT